MENQHNIDYILYGKSLENTDKDKDNNKKESFQKDAEQGLPEGFNPEKLTFDNEKKEIRRLERERRIKHLKEVYKKKSEKIKEYARKKAAKINLILQLQGRQRKKPKPNLRPSSTNNDNIKRFTSYERSNDPR